VTRPRIAPLGDGALTITWPGGISLETHRQVRAAAHRVRSAQLPAVRDLVPAYTTLSIFYDCQSADYETLARRVGELIEGDAADADFPPGREHRIRVVYDGPDLTDVARETGLSVAEVVARHTGRWYDVYLVGFVPGWAYLGELDPALSLPRRGSPRQRVPAGSVAIAGAQTGVYPFATPGGWHLIGRTDVSLFDPTRTPPALFQVGDRVRFEAT
jgi:KipI family sensor histidine kinase inhibitor